MGIHIVDRRMQQAEDEVIGSNRPSYRSSNPFDDEPVRRNTHDQEVWFEREAPPQPSAQQQTWGHDAKPAADPDQPQHRSTAQLEQTQAMLWDEQADAEEVQKWEMCSNAAHELEELCAMLAEITESSSENLRVIEQNVTKADDNMTAGFKTLVSTKKRQ